MNRFFVGEDQIKDGKIIITGGDLKHMKNVLRLDLGDRLEVVASGQVYLCEIKDYFDKEACLSILEKKEGSNEPKTKIRLYQGLIKGNTRMEYVIQKGTEIGVTEFVIVETSRSVAKITDGKKKLAKLERWQKIADEAGKQCKREVLPRVRDIISFKEMLEDLSGEENIFIPYEEERTSSLKSNLTGLESKNMNIIIGPEGGFEREEVEKIIGLGGKSVSLGPRILRTETAGLVTAAIILYEMGDI